MLLLQASISELQLNFNMTLWHRTFIRKLNYIFLLASQYSTVLLPTILCVVKQVSRPVRQFS